MGESKGDGGVEPQQQELEAPVDNATSRGPVPL